MSQRVFRDSEGRFRTEREWPGANVDGVAVVELRDPVGGYSYILDVPGKVAYRVKMQPGARGAAVPPNAKPVSATPPTPNSESLGTQTMEGILVEGRRETLRNPAGSMGNAQPASSAIERWTSSELGIAVLVKTSFPQGGDSTIRLTNIKRVEPDIALFRPPADFTIVDETGPSITVRFGR
jgi:hypothetical protein